MVDFSISEAIQKGSVEAVSLGLIGYGVMNLSQNSVIGVILIGIGFCGLLFRDWLKVKITNKKEEVVNNQTIDDKQ